jgi:cellobiose epimerase
LYKIIGMKKNFICLVVLVLAGLSTAAQNSRLTIARQMKFSLEKELLEPWYPKDNDSLYGGFLSTFSYDFTPIGNQEKMIVTQARHIWSNARAAELYPRKPWYKKSAQQGFYFLRDFFWDKKNGGFYTTVTRDGKFKSSDMGDKIAYGNAFGIYGLAAYYRCSEDTAALSLAKQAFYWLESHSHDSLYKGYYQHMEMDGTPVKRTATTASTAETGYKDQNSSIHLLEAFTELYQVWPDSLLAIRLKEMFVLVRDVITAGKGNLVLFFQPDWTPVSFRNTDRQTVLAHHNLDHISFGHDVETAYLLMEAAHVLGIKDDPFTLAKAKKMVDHALKNGWDSQLGGFYDEGYYFAGSDTITIIKDSKNWWAQAEGLNALLMMSDYCPADKQAYFKKFQQLWQYAQLYLIDHVHGDWYSGGLDKEPAQKMGAKGNIWKGTYHVLRSLANCIERLHPGSFGKMTGSTPQNHP